MLDVSKEVIWDHWEKSCRPESLIVIENDSDGFVYII